MVRQTTQAGPDWVNERKIVMEVILLERIEKLGQMGDTITVKPGFARNYLLPQNKALRATKENQKSFEARRGELEAANAERRSSAEKSAGTIDGITVILVRQASDSGQLYGSVRPRDIAAILREKDAEVDRTQIRLDMPIKMVGIHTVRVAIHPEVVVEVTVNVARSEEEAELQAQGKSMIGSGAADAVAEAAFADEADESADEELAEDGAEEIAEDGAEDVAEVSETEEKSSETE